MPYQSPFNHGGPRPVTTSTHVKSGPKSYYEQMSLQELQQYTERRQWMLDQERAGQLPRGWRTSASPIIQYSTTSISLAMTGKQLSPPLIDKLYEYALSILGQSEPRDLLGHIQQDSQIIEQLDKEMAEIDQWIEDADLILLERIADMQLRHQTQVEEKRRQREQLNDRRAQVYTRREHRLLQHGDQEMALLAQDGGAALVEPGDAEQYVQHMEKIVGS